MGITGRPYVLPSTPTSTPRSDLELTATVAIQLRHNGSLARSEKRHSLCLLARLQEDGVHPPVDLHEDLQGRRHCRRCVQRCCPEGHAVQGLPRQDRRCLQRHQVRRRCHSVQAGPHPVHREAHQRPYRARPPLPRRSARRRRRVSTCTSSASLLPRERPGLWTQRATSRSRSHRSLTTRTSKRILCKAWYAWGGYGVLRLPFCCVW